MVALTPELNFQTVIDEFFALKPMTGPHAAALQKQVCERAAEIFANPDLRYMPAFKILDLLAEMVNIATATAAEPQLRAHEATALLRASLSDNTPLIREFVLDAAIERARYEPMMLTPDPAQDIPHRDLALRKRWQAMLATHQSLDPLPNDWHAALTIAVDAVIAAEQFHSFRQGPLLQLFAEMLDTARHLHFEQASLSALTIAVGPASMLWKRYALKAARYAEKPVDAPGTLPAESRIPGDQPASNRVH